LRLNNVKGNTGYFCGGKIKGRKLFTDDSHEKNHMLSTMQEPNHK